jgi:hypothetical protein
MPTIKLEGDHYIYERITDDGRLTSYQVKIRRKGSPITMRPSMTSKRRDNSFGPC